MSLSPLLQRLIKSFQYLPGVGPKSAQRLAFHLLERQRSQAKQLAYAIQEAIEKIGHCQRCNNFSETAVCVLCENPKRDTSKLCIVESPSDVLAIEQTGCYNGFYFVLMGHLSPLDGIGPDDLNIAALEKQLDHGDMTEVILATNPTVEGEATAHYLAELIKERGIATSRIAYGVPLGGELEFIDGGTLTRAMTARDVF